VSARREPNRGGDVANLEQTLTNAIEATRSAQRFYGLLSDSTHDAAASSFLRSLSLREGAHGQAVGVMALELTSQALPPHAEHFIDGARVDSSWRTVDNVSFVQAVQLGIDSSSHAALMYEALADSSPPAAQELLMVLARQQEAHVALLQMLSRASKARARWQPRPLPEGGFPQVLRDAVMAEHAAASHHAMLGRRAADRSTRVFLQQLAADEQKSSDALDVMGLEAFDSAFPARARPHAAGAKLFAEVALPPSLDLHMALEYGLLAQGLGVLMAEQLAAQAPAPLAPQLQRFLEDQREEASTLAVRCDTYRRAASAEVRSVPAHELKYILEGWWKRESDPG